MVVLYIGDHGGLGLSGQKTNFTIPTWHLGSMVWYNQAQKYLQYDPDKLLQNFKEFYSMEFSTE